MTAKGSVFPGEEIRYYIVEQPSKYDNDEYDEDAEDFLPFTEESFEYLSHIQVSPWDSTPVGREEAIARLKVRNSAYSKYGRHFVLFSRKFSAFQPETDLA